MGKETRKKNERKRERGGRERERQREKKRRNATMKNAERKGGGGEGVEPLHHWGISLLLRWHCASPMPGRKWESARQGPARGSSGPNGTNVALWE